MKDASTDKETKEIQRQAPTHAVVLPMVGHGARHVEVAAVEHVGQAVVVAPRL